MGPANYQPVRYLDTMYITAPGWGDSGSGHVGDAGANFDVKDWMSLYQGDQQLDWGNAEYLQVPGLGAERLPYRLVLDNDRGAWANPYSTHTLTEWNFTSAVTGSESTASLPLIQLDYGVDTDKSGRADRHAGLTVTASHLPGTTAAIAKPSVEVSYDDGATWQRTDLSRCGDGWRTNLRAPRSAASPPSGSAPGTARATPSRRRSPGPSACADVTPGRSPGTAPRGRDRSGGPAHAAFPVVRGSMRTPRRGTASECSWTAGVPAE
ncbi:hypothetical protein ACFQ51_15215 [Streptomyces kaempferi]